MVFKLKFEIKYHNLACKRTIYFRQRTFILKNEVIEMKNILKLREFVAQLNTDELVYLIYKNHLKKNQIYDAYDI